MAGLFLSREKRQGIVLFVPGLAEPIKVNVIELTQGRVRLCVQAPDAVKILREPEHVSADGKVLGMITSGLGFGGPAVALPWSLVNQVAETLKTHGKVARGYLGIGSQPITLSQQAKDLAGGQERGLLVIQVADGGPAATGGVLQGDILVKLDGTTIGNADDLQGLLTPNRVGSGVTASVVRGGELRELSLTVGSRD